VLNTLTLENLQGCMESWEKRWDRCTHTCPRGLLRRRRWKLGVRVINFFLWSNSPNFWVAPRIIQPWFSMLKYHPRDEKYAHWWPQFRDVILPHQHDHYHPKLFYTRYTSYFSVFLLSHTNFCRLWTQH
jgi:hypothetical protein